MKHRFLLTAVITALLLAACGESEENRERREKIEELENRNVQMQLDYNDLQEYLAVIADGLDSIRIEENELLLNNTSGEGSGWNRQRMKQNLDQVRRTLGRHRSRISELEAKLAEGSGSVRHLHTIVASLREQLDRKELELEQLRIDLEDNRKNVRELTERVEEITEEKSELTQTVVAQQETIEEQSRLMSQARMLIASKKQLEKAGLLKSGGFLRKKKLDVSAIDLSGFTVVDTRTFSTLQLPQKVKILTDIPAGSYRLEKNREGQLLTVTDPDRFWSLSNVLIIQTD